MSKLILVGIVVSAHGIKGEITVRSFTQPVINISQLPLVNLDNHQVSLKLVRQNANGNLVCKISNIVTRNQAETLVGSQLFCLRSSLPVPRTDEFYVEDLKNLVVFDVELQVIGKVSDIYNYGAGDIIEITFDSGIIELLPFTKELFPVITADYLIFNPASETGCKV